MGERREGVKNRRKVLSFLFFSRSRNRYSVVSREIFTKKKKQGKKFPETWVLIRVEEQGVESENMKSYFQDVSLDHFLSLFSRVLYLR